MLSHLSARQLAVTKTLVFGLALLPFLRLVISIFTDQLGANPIEFITRNTGDWALYFLCLTLLITPLRRLLKWNWLIRFRRMLGLFAFFYATLHFTTFFWFDHFFDLGEMFRDVVRRPFIAVGFAAFVLLIPLAVTSTNAMVKRLGGKRWLWLHRLIYVIAPLAILHYWWMKAGKNDLEQPLIFGLIVLALLGLRLVWAVRKSHTGGNA
ncbi:MAG: protein-methionine-sulfoxide reductase heme-binding subunit MsrQ [Oxalicibacterium faecigallinarum]|uniref:sulfite oxidase heme-binding subunit YedZ n=1 Tax=Oxalicibacterium faecigallinarum TaxID=573741 RepID=UPI002808BBDD|nr:protein-methionine-sulfoxide reductase heme-binding subunit MsrQ [Oxalicibacterium faecigallinarum]MDQ7968583.1 protein-methionine-sulfoxide reductase heme-binding subunit MsrQ [Oxalicibacterium faecigallinarum]